jgi:hypothetical protein
VSLHSNGVLRLFVVHTHNSPPSHRSPPASIPSEKWNDTHNPHTTPTTALALSLPAPHHLSSACTSRPRSEPPSSRRSSPPFLAHSSSSSCQTPPPPRVPRTRTLAVKATCREARIARAMPRQTPPGNATPTTHARAAARSRAPLHEVNTSIDDRAAQLGTSGSWVENDAPCVRTTVGLPARSGSAAGSTR